MGRPNFSERQHLHLELVEMEKEKEDEKKEDERYLKEIQEDYKRYEESLLTPYDDERIDIDYDARYELMRRELRELMVDDEDGFY